MNQEPKLFLLRGVSGVGKTTLAHILLRAFPGGWGVMLAADDWMIDSAGNYKFQPELLEYAHAQCLKETEEALRKGLAVIVHNTFAAAWQLAPYIEAAKNCNVQYTVLLCESGWRSDVHNAHEVPDKVIRNMRDHFQVRV